MVARARPARRAPDAGDEAGRRRRAGRSLRAPPATSSRTTARAAGTASPSPAASASPTWSRTSASRCARRDARTCGDDEPLAEARMISAVCGGVRVVSLYAPNGRVVDSPFYQAKLAWFERLARWLAEARDPGDAAGPRRRLQRRARRRRRLGPDRLPRRHARLARPSARPSRGSARWGLVDAYRLHHPSPGATPGGTTAPATSTRTSACASTTCWSRAPLAERDRRRGDRPRGAQGQADPVGPRAARRSTSTSRGHPSTRAGPGPRAA